MLKTLYLKFIKFVIGKTSVVANVNVSGEIQIGSGLVWRSHFTKRPLENTDTFNCSHHDFVHFPSASSGLTLDCTFDARTNP